MEHVRALLTLPILNGVREQLKYERNRYVKLHEQFAAAAMQHESVAKQHYEDADCCLVMIAMLDKQIKELPSEPTKD